MPSNPTSRVPIGSKRDRFLVILLGVLIGYVVGNMLEARFGWERIGMLTMPLGGLVTGVLGRLIIERYDESRRSQ